MSSTSGLSPTVISPPPCSPCSMKLWTTAFFRLRSSPRVAVSPTARPRHSVRAERGNRPDCATDEEVAALLQACHSWRDRFLVYLLFSTGLRRGAVGGLRRSDLHFADCSTELGCTITGAHLHVRRRQNVNKATSKSRADFHVPVDHHALALYERYLNEQATIARRPSTATSCSSLSSQNRWDNPWRCRRWASSYRA